MSRPALLLVLLLVGDVAGQRPGIDQCVCLVRGRTAKSPFSGSGVTIGYDAASQTALVVTARHVTAGAVGPLTLTYPTGLTVQATVLAQDRVHDIALLTFRSEVRPTLTAVASGYPTRGEQIWQCGYPGGQGPRTQTGTATYPGHCYCHIYPGDSGGGVFTNDGRLVGVSVGVIVGNESDCVCEPCECVRVLQAQCWPPTQCSPIWGCPQPAPPSRGPVVTAPPAGSRPPTPRDDDDVREQLAQLRRAVEELGKRKPEPVATPGPELAQVVAELQTIKQQLAQAQARPGPAGPAGPPGPAGPAGPAGPQAPPVDLESIKGELAAAIVSKTNPGELAELRDRLRVQESQLSALKDQLGKLSGSFTIEVAPRSK